jgi:hypothetical protein
MSSTTENNRIDDTLFILFVHKLFHLQTKIIFLLKVNGQKKDIILLIFYHKSNFFKLYFIMIFILNMSQNSRECTKLNIKLTLRCKPIPVNSLKYKHRQKVLMFRLSWSYFFVLNKRRIYHYKCSNLLFLFFIYLYSYT